MDSETKPDRIAGGTGKELDTPAPVAAVILAAGGSARMGEPKQLLALEGQPMVRRVTEAVCAANLAQVVVVVGARAPAIEQAISGLDVDLVINEAWREGMSTSVRAGIGALSPEIQAALLVLADQPALTPSILQTLVNRYRTTGARIVAPFYEGRRGNPVLFDRALFPELLAIQGDQGGRAVVARYSSDVEQVEIQDPRTFMDVDTRQDYEAIQTRGTGE